MEQGITDVNCTCPNFRPRRLHCCAVEEQLLSRWDHLLVLPQQAITIWHRPQASSLLLGSPCAKARSIRHS